MEQKSLNEKKAIRFRRFAGKAYGAFNSMHKIVNIGVIAGCVLAFSYTKQTYAQGNVLTEENKITEEQELGEVTVTASRTETPLNQAARLVAVITRQEIERSPVQSVQDLLKYAIGVDVRQRGPNGIQSDISVRGGTFDQVAILLNGSNLTNPQTGHYSFDIPVNLSDIERIEIIQGPGSLLYGASAFAGGINIITKKLTGNQAYAGLESGMHRSFGANAGGSLQSGIATHHLSMGLNTSGGYMDNSDYTTFSSLWQSNLRTEQSKLDMQLGYNQKGYGANTFYSAEYPNQYDKTNTIFASVRGETGDKVKFVPQIYWNRLYNHFELYRDGTPGIPDWYKNHNDHYSDVYGFNLDIRIRSKIGITNFGGEFRNEGIKSNVLGKLMEVPDGKYTHSDNRSNISYFVEQNILLEQFTASVGILANQNTFLNEDYKFYPAVNVSYLFSDHYRVYASWNNAVRMPTFTDLYYTTATHAGNTNLKHEESESFELGLKFNNHFLSSYITGFYMKGKNVIDWVKENPDDLWESHNFTQLNKTGFESSFSFRLKELINRLPEHTELKIGYMYLNQTKDAGNFISNYALDYLKHKFTAELNHPVWNGLSANWQFRWQDRMGSYTKYENLKPSAETPYSAYSILDLKLNYRLKPFDFYLNFNNLFDITYNDLGNIPQPGFWFMGGIKATFNNWK